jgi:uncharacterized repeat protein (TIGR03803 family)
MILDARGNLYGTTALGGTYGYGVVFKLSQDGTETVLHTFGVGRDGQIPYSDLLMDSDGTIYGTTQDGGTHSKGTVYRLTSDGAETVLYNFCSAGGLFCTDGAIPLGGLIADAQGNLYGTTFDGGDYEGGVVFKLSPSGTLTVLHSFASGTDGFQPSGTMVRDSAGNLYGTTEEGGSTGACPTLGSNGCGTIFKVASDGTVSVIYAFCRDDAGKCADGVDPGDLLVDKYGNLWGAAYLGGTHKQGVVFFVTPSGHETVVHNFDANGADGARPDGGLVMDKAGNLYGTTTSGGATLTDGTVYEIDPPGEESILHSFGLNSLDGTKPTGKLVMDSEGNLYGITGSGGPGGGGTVFKVTP